MVPLPDNLLGQQWWLGFISYTEMAKIDNHNHMCYNFQQEGLVTFMNIESVARYKEVIYKKAAEVMQSPEVKLPKILKAPKPQAIKAIDKAKEDCIAKVADITPGFKLDDDDYGFGIPAVKNYLKKKMGNTDVAIGPNGQIGIGIPMDSPKRRKIKPMPNKEASEKHVDGNWYQGWNNLKNIYSEADTNGHLSDNGKANLSNISSGDVSKYRGVSTDDFKPGAGDKYISKLRKSMNKKASMTAQYKETIYKKAADLNAADRKSLPKSNFALPSKMMFPMPDEQHVRLAWRFLNRAKISDSERATAAKAIKRRAKSMGINTDSWK